MMHKNDLVVAIYTAHDSKPIREHYSQHQKRTPLSRSSKVFVTPGSEYKFCFKNLKPTRRRVTISIDGSQVGDWVLPGGSKDLPVSWFIERYADVDRKFKVQSASHEEVSDPTNPDNGKIEIKVWDEAPFFGTFIAPHNLESHPIGWGTGYPSSAGNPSAWKGWTTSGPTMFGAASASGDSSGFDSAVLRSCSVNYAQQSTTPVDQKVATVEGSKSDQVFSTTYWAGDHGLPMTFEFYLVGKVQETEQTIKATQYCYKCSTKLMKDAAFCHHCGCARA